MTNHERAEKIFKSVSSYEFQPTNSWQMKQIALIISHLDEAVREAWGKDDLDHFERVQKQGFREGFTAAREKAHEILSLSSIDYDGVADALDKIEAIEADGKEI